MKRTRDNKSSKRPTKQFKKKTTRKHNRVEKKNYDYFSNATIVAGQATAFTASICTPDQGTSPTEHIGRAINLRSVQYRWVGSFATTTAGTSPLRLVIVYDRQPNAALAATTQIFAADNISAMPNLSNNRRFTIIADETIEGLSAQGPSSFSLTGYRKINLDQEFNDVNGGTVADITTGNLIVLAWQNGNIITASPTNALYIRTRYTDM